MRELTDALHSTIDSLEIPSPADALNNGIDFYEEIKRYEISLIESALRSAHGSQMQAAKLLNLKPTTLNAKIKLYDIHWKCCSKAYVGATSRKVSSGKS